MPETPNPKKPRLTFRRSVYHLVCDAAVCNLDGRVARLPAHATSAASNNEGKGQQWSLPAAAPPPTASEETVSGAELQQDDQERTQ